MSTGYLPTENFDYRHILCGDAEEGSEQAAVDIFSHFVCRRGCRSDAAREFWQCRTHRGTKPH